MEAHVSPVKWRLQHSQLLLTERGAPLSPAQLMVQQSAHSVSQLPLC